MRIDSAIITGSFSINGDTFNDLGAYTTTGSNTFVGDQSIVGAVSASALTGSINYTNITNVPTLISGSEQIIGILSPLNSFTASNSTTNTFTSSATARLNALETTSASVDTLNTTQNTRLNSLENKTGSLATTGSNIFYGNQTISGTVYIQSDLIVQGSSCIQNITGSSLNIGTNIVSLNTATPSVRYAGMTVQDSGSSAGVTGSILWDSLCNRWMYSNPSTVGYSGGIIMSGPRAATLGAETTLTCNYIAKSGGGDHLYDSAIYESGSCVGIGTNTPLRKLDIVSTGEQLRLAYDTSGTVYSDFRNDSAGGLLINTAGPYIVNYINGSAKMRIDANAICFPVPICSPTLYSTDCINIGTTTSLGSRLSIQSANDQAGITMYNTYDCNKWSIRTGTSDISNKGFAIQDDICNATRLQINSIGHIGIGTKTPCSNLHVYFNADVWHTRIGSANNELRIGGDTASGAVIQSYTTNGVVRDLYLQRDGGKIGIGTANALSKVHIYASCACGAGGPNANTLLLIDSDAHQLIEMRTCSSAYGAMQGIAFTDNGLNAFVGYKEYTCQTAGTYGEAIHLAFYDYSASDPNNGIYFGTSTTPNCGVSKPLMFIKGNGCVGIGTCTPESTLHINGTNSGGYGASLTLTNVGTAANTATGIDFGVDASTAGGGLGNAQIKVVNIGGASGANCSDMIFTMWDGSTFNERLRIKDKRNILIDTGNNASQVQTATPSALRFNNDYSNGYTDASLKLYLFNSGATIHGFTSGPSYDIQYHSSGHNDNAKHVFYTNCSSKLSIHPTSVCVSVPIINTSNNKAHTFCQLNSTNFSTKTFVYTGNSVSSFAVTDFSGIPSNAKAVQVYGWYHITGYSAGSGQGDHAMSWFGPATINNTTQWAGAGSAWPNGESTYTPRFHGTFVMEHDGDASIQTGNSGAMHYYGSWHQGTINVHTDGNIYYSIGAGISGGTHYNALVATGYWI